VRGKPREGRGEKGIVDLGIVKVAVMGSVDWRVTPATAVEVWDDISFRCIAIVGIVTCLSHTKKHNSAVALLNKPPR